MPENLLQNLMSVSSLIIMKVTHVNHQSIIGRGIISLLSGNKWRSHENNCTKSANTFNLSFRHLTFFLTRAYFVNGNTYLMSDLADK